MTLIEFEYHCCRELASAIAFYGCSLWGVSSSTGMSPYNGSIKISEKQR